VRLVGYLKKKTITMHGNMNVHFNFIIVVSEVYCKPLAVLRYKEHRLTFTHFTANCSHMPDRSITSIF